MTYIPLEEHLPGITGLLEYRRDTAEPIRDLTQFLLRGPSSLTAAERELIAASVSYRNQCQYCTTAHSAIANQLLGEEQTVRTILEDVESSPVSEKLKMLLVLADQVADGGKHVTATAVNRAREAGASDVEIHDTVLIAALFCFYNRYVDGLATVTPSDPGYYARMARRIAGNGYLRPPQGYDHLKSRQTNEN